MELIYSSHFFCFKGKVWQLRNFLETLPKEITVKDYLKLVLH
jgi:hypothetical protein